MSDLPNPDSLKPAPYGGSWRVRLAVGVLIILAIGVVLVTNRWLSERFTETTRNRAELRLALYSGNMLSELQRTSVVPLLLVDDPAIRGALSEGRFADTTLVDDAINNNAIRFKDWSDYQAVGQNIGTGNGTLTAFQLTKT